MKQVSRSELETLMQERPEVALSIYAPMVKAGQETQQNPIRFKNLVRKAADDLEARGVAPKEAERLLAPLHDLIEDFGFWQHQGDGLAVFRSADLLRVYRVPLEVRELAVVEDRFHLKPLLPILTGDGRFYILALSQKHARLFEATHHKVSEIDLGDLPTSLEEALGYQIEETHLQFHSNFGGGGGAGKAPVYHGHGGGEDDAKAEIRKFFNLLDHGIVDLIEDRQAPLVLAGVEYLFPIYRETTGHPNLVENGVPGNPDGLSADELHQRAWPVVEPVFKEVQRQAAERYEQLAGTGQTSHRLEEVVTAADDGRVDTLFVALGTRRWGAFDRENRSVEVFDHNGPGSEDLVDFAAIQTLLKGGTVFAVPPEAVPEGDAVAAVYRY